MSDIQNFINVGVLNTIKNYKNKIHLKDLDSSNRKLEKIIKFITRDDNQNDRAKLKTEFIIRLEDVKLKFS